MANITITVQSLLNTAVYDSYTIDNAQTINQLKAAINSARGVDSAWYDIVQNQSIVSGTATLASLGVTTGTVLRTHNKISHMATRELRQKAKLDLAALDRTASSNDRSTYDITELPTQYSDNAIYDNPNTGGLTLGRPWIDAAPFTFYEAIDRYLALETTQYVSGNKIYAYSSTYDVPGYQNARVVVNDIEVLNNGLAQVARGHNMVVLDSNGDLISTAIYDTYDTLSGALAALTLALTTVASGNIVVLVVWDASGCDAAVRTALQTYYGSTNTDKWAAIRYDHIFIGVRA